jgi:glycosyltransferase involved in cell wall biosynthesis
MIDPADPDFSNTPVSAQRPRFLYSTRSSRTPAEKSPTAVVTVVTGTSRAEEIFGETAQSILGQSLQSWEWIIVDDASESQSSRDLIHEISARDSRIRVLRHKANRGPGAARNTGVDAAKSEYIYFIDDDDLIEPTTLEKSLWFLETHPEFDFVNGWSIAFGDQRYLWKAGFDQRDAFLENNMATGRCMIRKSAHDAAGGFDESLREGFEDWDLWLRCAQRGSWGGTIPHFMDWYRRRENHNDRWGEWDEGNREVTFRDRLRARYPNLYSKGFPLPESHASVPFARQEKGFPCRNKLPKHPRRVIMILPWLSMGGSDKFNLDLLAGLSRKGWEVSIVTTLRSDSAWEPEFARYTPDIFHLHDFLPPDQHPRFLRYMIRSRRPGVVFASHSEFAYLITPYLRAHCPAPVYLDYCHIEMEDWMGGGYPRFSVASQAHFDLNIVSSQHLRKWMKERGGNDEKIEVLYTNVDTSRWTPIPSAREGLRRTWRVDDDTPVILFSGRICSQKQPMVLARTLEELATRNLRFKLVIAGDGEDRGALEEFVRRRRLGERVQFLGEISNREMRHVMSAADLFFLPSQWEGIALALFEAMAMELAIVGADVGGQRELVTPELGKLLPRGDEATEAKAYADALEPLLLNPKLRRSRGKRGRERVEANFRLDAMVDRFVSLVGVARKRREKNKADLLSPELGDSWATQAIEYTRMSALADQLWAERHTGQGQTSAMSSPDTLAEKLVIERHLENIENSRSWRWVEYAHGSSLGRLARALRLAQDLKGIQDIDSAQLRLSRIEATRSYRLICFLKKTPPHRLWVRLRYGK